MEDILVFLGKDDDGNSIIAKIVTISDNPVIGDLHHCVTSRGNDVFRDMDYLRANALDKSKGGTQVPAAAKLADVTDE